MQSSVSMQPGVKLVHVHFSSWCELFAALVYVQQMQKFILLLLQKLLCEDDSRSRPSVCIAMETSLSASAEFFTMISCTWNSEEWLLLLKHCLRDWIYLILHVIDVLCKQKEGFVSITQNFSWSLRSFGVLKSMSLLKNFSSSICMSSNMPDKESEAFENFPILSITIQADQSPV